VLAVLLPALTSGAARAGTYEVVACGGAAGGAQNAFAASADAGMAAYNACPNTPTNPSSGIVTRASATAGPGSVPYFAGAYQIFDAPPGSSLVSVSFDVAVIRLATYWTTGVVAYDSSANFNHGEGPYGCYAGNQGCAIGLHSFFGPVTAALNGHTKFRFETRCGNPGGCDISASGYQLGMRALFSAANVRVQVQDFTAPVVTFLNGPMLGSGWLRGLQSGFSSEYDNVGVMLNRTSIDGQVVFQEDFRDPSWGPSARCDFTRARPCNDIPGAGSLFQTRGLTDGIHELRVEAIDSAGNYGSAARTIKIDNTAPARVNAFVEGGEGWRTQNRFNVGWPVPGPQASPIVTARYSLCSVAAAPRCTGGSRTAAGIARLEGISVPSLGEYDLRVWLEDEAGNVDTQTASDPVRLRFDDQPPQAAFELQDETDPTRIDVRASDSGSGIASGLVEIRRVGWRQWHALDTAVERNRLTARLNDLELPDGRYELRALVRDRAGNEGASSERTDGAKMELSLPLRSASRIVLSGGAGCRPTSAGRKCRRRARIRRSRGGTVLAGVLQTAAGRPLAGELLVVLQQSRTGGAFHEVAAVRSNPSGEFRQRLGKGPSRTIRVRYDGTALVKPSVSTLELRVPAATTIAASRRSLRNGESVRFSGRLRGRPIPEGGKLIDLQAFYRGKWRTFATPRTDADGRWWFRYRFEATSGLVRYRFRARIRREVAYPYELGYSRVVEVTVRGR
jgi:hypothetical protein